MELDKETLSLLLRGLIHKIETSDYDISVTKFTDVERMLSHAEDLAYKLGLKEVASDIISASVAYGEYQPWKAVAYLTEAVEKIDGKIGGTMKLRGHRGLYKKYVEIEFKRWMHFYSDMGRVTKYIEFWEEKHRAVIVGKDNSLLLLEADRSVPADPNTIGYGELEIKIYKLKPDKKIVEVP